MATDDTHKAQSSRVEQIRQQADAKDQPSRLKQQQADMSTAELLDEQDREQKEQQDFANEQNAVIDLKRAAAQEEQLQSAEKNKEPEEEPKKDDSPSACRYKKPQDITEAIQKINEAINQIHETSPKLVSKEVPANFLTMDFQDDQVVAVTQDLRMVLKNNDDGIGSTFSFSSNDNSNMIQKSMAAGAMQATLIHVTTDATKGFNFQATQDIATLRASPKDRKALSTYSAVVAGSALGMNISLNGNKVDPSQVKEIQKDLTFTVQKEQSLAELLSKGRSGLRPTPRPSAKTPEPKEPSSVKPVEKVNPDVKLSSPVVDKTKALIDPTVLAKDEVKLKASTDANKANNNTTAPSRK